MHLRQGIKILPAAILMLQGYGVFIIKIHLKEGVRAFMSRDPEVQLDYLIDKGLHH